MHIRVALLLAIHIASCSLASLDGLASSESIPDAPFDARGGSEDAKSDEAYADARSDSSRPYLTSDFEVASFPGTMIQFGRQADMIWSTSLVDTDRRAVFRVPASGGAPTELHQCGDDVQIVATGSDGVYLACDGCHIAHIGPTGVVETIVFCPDTTNSEAALTPSKLFVGNFRLKVLTRSPLGELDSGTAVSAATNLTSSNLAVRMGTRLERLYLASRSSVEAIDPPYANRRLVRAMDGVCNLSVGDTGVSWASATELWFAPHDTLLPRLILQSDRNRGCEVAADEAFLYYLDDSSVARVNVATGRSERLTGLLPYTPSMLAVSNGVVYWLEQRSREGIVHGAVLP